MSSIIMSPISTLFPVPVSPTTSTVESVGATVEWAIENRFTFAAFNVLMPYPRTPLYARLAEEGRLLYDGRWWLHPDYRFNHAAYRPARMTADQPPSARRYWQEGCASTSC